MAAALAIADTARPRSRAAVSASRSTPAAAATSWRLMSGLARGGARVPTSTRMVLTPAPASPARRDWYSLPFVSRVPTGATGLSLIAPLPFSGGAPPPRAPRRAEPGVAGSRRTPLRRPYSLLGGPRRAQHSRPRDQLFRFFHHGSKVLTSLPGGCNVA